MEERKKVAKEISNKFAAREALVTGGHMLLLVIAVVAAVANLWPLPTIFMILFIVAVPFDISLTNTYSSASEIMVCRALVGQKISDDPVQEGLDQYKKIGRKTFYAKSRAIGAILYATARGAMKVAGIMDQIPGLNKVSFIYKRVVEKAYNNTAKLLVSYQIGTYGESNEEDYYDLVTYFVQDGKNFLLKTVKTEVRDYILSAILFVFIGISFIAVALTQSLSFGFAAIAALVLSFVLGIVMHRNDKLNTLGEYVEYVQTHAVNQQLRNNIISTCSTTDNILDIRRAFVNPSAYSVERAADSVQELAEKISGR